MTFLERLQSHKGSLIKLKTELFWYGGRGWDENPGRVCLLLDAAAAAAARTPAVFATGAAAAAAAFATGAAARRSAAAYLLIDGSPRWVWVAEEDMALL